MSITLVLLNIYICISNQPTTKPMSIQNKRKLKTLKMELTLFNKAEKKRKKEKKFKTFHELGIHLLTEYSK